jgi:hypothetical protein
MYFKVSSVHRDIFLSHLFGALSLHHCTTIKFHSSPTTPYKVSSLRCHLIKYTALEIIFTSHQGVSANKKFQTKMFVHNPNYPIRATCPFHPKLFHIIHPYHVKPSQSNKCYDINTVSYVPSHTNVNSVICRFISLHEKLSVCYFDEDNKQTNKQHFQLNFIG